MLMSVVAAWLTQPALATDPAAGYIEEFFTVAQSKQVPMVSLGGTVIPSRQVTLSAQVPGRIKSLSGIEGDQFLSGALLVAIDETELLAQRNAAMAQLTNAQAQLKNAGVQYNRELWSPKSKSSMGGMGMPNLWDEMFSRPMEDFAGTRDTDAERSADLFAQGAQVTQARSAITQAQSAIEGVDAKLRNAQSLAPFNGIIMKKFIEEGDTVQPGMPLITFADISYLQIDVDVPARLRQGLQEGMILQGQLDVNNQVVNIRIAQIFPMADAQRHTIKVKFDLEQGVSSPGMYAKVRLPDFSASAASNPVIPASAIRYRGSLPGVFILDNNHHRQLRLIRVGQSHANGMVSVLSGIRKGERVVRFPNRQPSSAPSQ